MQQILCLIKILCCLEFNPVSAARTDSKLSAQRGASKRACSTPTLREGKANKGSRVAGALRAQQRAINKGQENDEGNVAHALCSCLN